MVHWKELSSTRHLPEAQTWRGACSASCKQTRTSPQARRIGSVGLLSISLLRPLWRTNVRPGGWCKGLRMASSEGTVDPHGAITAVSTSNSKCKIKRTPVILNYPRKPDVAHFRVLQWNVLADGLAQNGDFCRTPPACLEWEYRRPLLLQEILEANADIICLQELNHFDELNQVLSGLGYDGAFREKHASPALKYEFPPDGMAVFYRRNRFRCCANGVEGRSFRDDSTGREHSQGFLQIMLHDMVVGRELLIVTTHLKAKDGAECEDLRLQQANQLLRNVEATMQRLENGYKGAAEAPTKGDSVTNGGVVRCSSEGTVAGNGTASTSTASATGAAAGSAARGFNGNGTGNSNGNGSGAMARPAVDATINGSGKAGSSQAATARNGSCIGEGGRWGIPVVITGDFNTMPGSKTCEAFRRHPLGLLSLWEQRPLNATFSSGSGSDMELPLQSQLQLLVQNSGSSSLTGVAEAIADAMTTQTNGAISSSPTSGTLQQQQLLPPQQQQQQQYISEAAAVLLSGAPGEDSHVGQPNSSTPTWQSEFSTWKFRVKGESKRIIDYIWFSGGGSGGVPGPLRPLQRWRMLTEEEIGPGALPSAAYASDHVSLCCEFEWDVDVDLEWAPPSGEADWG